MARGRQEVFTTVRSEGALLPPDFLRQIAEGRDKIPGLTSEAYHLPGTERLNEAASRSWNRLLGAWVAFQTASQSLAETDPGTGITREKWLLPLFQELGYGRLLTARAFEIEGKPYPISHAWQHTPIHLVGRNVDLDRRSPGVAGAAKASPHGLVQEFLNRSTDHLWGLLSNGIKLRIMRESKSLTRQAYIEFDLAGMMEGQVYADFAILWLLCHQSRVEAERPAECWLEKWSETARAQGTRALEDLRTGVEEAIEALGCGFLAFPSNIALREQLQGGTLDKQDYFRQLLRIAYRLIFLFIAEDRDLLLTAEAGSRERKRYLRYYSADRLRALAERRRGSPHPDLWQGLRLVFEKLGADTGCPSLGLPALGSFLWSERATPDLNDCQVANRELLQAIRALAFTQRNNVRRPIDYKNIGTEELGSVYQSLLEQHPDVHVSIAKFTLGTHAGHERKTTGSFYTPSPLVQSLLDTALEPVLRERIESFATLGYTSAEEAILAMKVADISCGSGHFLIAAAHRMAKRLATIRTGEEEPAPDAIRHALRDVIGRCTYGVDINPMAVELCKFALWLEALQPGKPLSFLDHHIQCGNSLLGATPALLKTGIPDEAFELIEGDDKGYCRKFKKENKKERTGQMRLIEHKWEPWQKLGSLATAIVELDAIADDTVQGQRAKQERWEQLVRSSGYEFGRLLADAWCAAFVWKKRPDPVLQYPITEDTFRRIEQNPHWAPAWLKEEVRRLAAEYQFFHWHLAFPDVFRLEASEGTPTDGPGWLGGFDVILGNPPWERVKLQEKEFFAEPRPDIANAPNASARGKMIKALEREDPPLFQAFRAALRRSDGESAVVRRTGRYPLCGRGDVNTYSIFAELNRSLAAPGGRAGFIVPSGIATDDTTKYFFDDLVNAGSLVSLYSFFETRKVFLDTDSRNPFCLLTVKGGLDRSKQEMWFAFDLRSVSDLLSTERRFALTAEEIALLNPNTRTCPIFRTRCDAELTKSIYRRIPVLVNEEIGESGDSWKLRDRTRRVFDMAKQETIALCRSDASSPSEDRMLRMYEAKMIHQFTHRYGDYAHKASGSQSTALPEVPDDLLNNPTYVPTSRFWIDKRLVDERLQEKWEREWLLCWRDICRNDDERTVIAAVIPRAGTDFTLRLGLSSMPEMVGMILLGILNAFVVDYCARQKLGGTHLADYVLKQLPILPLGAFGKSAPWCENTSLSDWVGARVLELSYTSEDLAPFSVDLGYRMGPFRWEPDRRFRIRCELDASFFHLYGIARDEVDYIMDTFPIVRRKDEEKHGEYRTKRVILEIYDAMQESIRTGHPYQPRLDPPPADPSCCHPSRGEDR